MNSKIKHIHFIACCGTAMGSLAAMLKSKGYNITGSDSHVYPPMSTFLESQGIHIYQGFDSAHLEPKPDLVIIGNAMSRGNPEVEAVLERKIPYTSMPIALKEFFIQGKHSIVVAGTHGKTTTSSIVAWLLENAGKAPGFLIGGIPQNFNQGFQVGDGDIFIVEGDEYDSAYFDKAAKFFHYLPDIVVLNNIEFDHADIYDNLDQIKLAFKRLINLIPGNGLLLAGAEDKNVKEIMSGAFSAVQTFGLNGDFYWNVKNIKYYSDKTVFDVYKDQKFFANFSIPLFGDHNIRNSVAAIGVAVFHDISENEIQAGLSTFKSIKKRLEIKATINDIIIYDDFAHHPTAVKLTVEGLRNQYPDRKIWAVYEPRTSTAKRKIMEDQYSESFDAADEIILAPLHLPDKVHENKRLSIKNLITKLEQRNKTAYYIESVEKIINFLVNEVKPQDLILIMSNGAFGGIHDLLIKRLMNSENERK